MRLNGWFSVVAVDGDWKFMLDLSRGFDISRMLGRTEQ